MKKNLYLVIVTRAKIVHHWPFRVSPRENESEHDKNERLEWN